MTDESIGRPLPGDPIDPLGSAPPAPVASDAPQWPDPAFIAPAPLEPDPIGRDQPDDDDGEPAARPIDRQIRTILEWVAVAVGALAVALIIKTFLLQAFYIPSGSMETTLVRGDRVLVNKLSYDLHDINRGDLVVFEKPPGEGGDIDDLIKRVIALPGETVAFQDGSIFIDGLLLEEPYLEPDVPSLAKVVIPNCDGVPSVDSCTVPAGRIFVMGDNREDSRDSRFFGPIEDETIVGRAFLKVWPLNDLGFL